MAIAGNSSQANSRIYQARQFQAIPGKDIRYKKTPDNFRQGNFRKFQASQLFQVSQLFQAKQGKKIISGKIRQGKANSGKRQGKVIPGKAPQARQFKQFQER